MSSFALFSKCIWEVTLGLVAFSLTFWIDVQILCSATKPAHVVVDGDGC